MTVNRHPRRRCSSSPSSRLGAAKILAVPPMRAAAAHVGFSVAAYRRIGVLEVAGAVGLLVGLRSCR